MIKFIWGYLLGLLVGVTLFCATAEATCNGNEKLLMHLNGADASTTITDSSSSAHSPTAVGNAQIDTAQSKFGGASVLFDGTGDYISVPDSVDWDLSTGDFTIDFWFRMSADFATDGKTVHTFFAPDTNDTGLVLSVDDENNVIRATLFPNARTFAFSPTKDTWYHLALTRSGTDLRAFIDGTQVGTTLTDSTDIQSSSSVFVGSDHAQTTSQMTQGWIDEFRVVKGSAVWTSNFTPETTEYCAARRRIMLVE